MHRFFTENTIDNSGNIRITGGDVKHIKNVLRITSGQMVEIVTENKPYLCTVTEIDKTNIIARVVNSIEKSNESPLKINLFQGLPKSTKMEIILQKCTEIGVTNFFPLITSRTIVKFKDEKKELRKTERWQAIVYEAAKQSKRDIVPIVNSAIEFKELEKELREGITIVPYEAMEGNSIKTILKSTNKPEVVNIIIGPEGGFEEREVQRLDDLGAEIVSLGPRILRTETAGMFTAVLLQYEYGDLGVI